MYAAWRQILMKYPDIVSSVSDDPPRAKIDGAQETEQICLKL